MRWSSDELVSDHQESGLGLPGRCKERLRARGHRRSKDRVQYPWQRLQADREGQLQNETCVYSVHPHPRRVQQGRLENDEHDNRDQGFGLRKLLANLSRGPFAPSPNIRVSPRRSSRSIEREDLSQREEALAELLTLLIEDYEEKYHPLPRVSPGDRLNALMEERGLKHKDIWPSPGQQGSRH